MPQFHFPQDPLINEYSMTDSAALMLESIPSEKAPCKLAMKRPFKLNIILTLNDWSQVGARRANIKIHPSNRISNFLCLSFFSRRVGESPPPSATASGAPTSAWSAQAWGLGRSLLHLRLPLQLRVALLGHEFSPDREKRQQLPRALLQNQGTELQNQSRRLGQNVVQCWEPR